MSLEAETRSLASTPHSIRVFHLTSSLSLYIFNNLNIFSSALYAGIHFFRNSINMLIILHIQLTFRKVGSRRVYTVTEADLLSWHSSKGKKKTKAIMLESCSDDQFPSTKNNKEKCELLKEVKETWHDQHRDETFSQLAQATLWYIQMPVVPFHANESASVWCCKSILRCEECVDTWFGGGQGWKIHSLCRAERAHTDTCHLNRINKIPV